MRSLEYLESLSRFYKDLQGFGFNQVKQNQSTLTISRSKGQIKLFTDLYIRIKGVCWVGNKRALRNQIDIDEFLAFRLDTDIIFVSIKYGRSLLSATMVGPSGGVRHTLSIKLFSVNLGSVKKTESPFDSRE